MANGNNKKNQLINSILNKQAGLSGKRPRITTSRPIAGIPSQKLLLT